MGGEKILDLHKEDLEGEVHAYVEHINNLLQGDKYLEEKNIIPLKGMDIFSSCTEGVLLAKLIAAVRPGVIAVEKLNLGIDLTELETQVPGSKAIFKVTENQNLTLQAAEKLGIKLVNIGANDIISGKPDLVLGFVWQVIRAHLLQDINVLDHPELIRLMQKGESIQTMIDMGSEQLLIRWFNYHLKRAGSDRTVKNFSESIKDSVCYLNLLKQIAPKLVDVSLIDTALESGSNEVRAMAVLESAEKLGCRKFVTLKDIVGGHARLNLAFTATLFNSHIGIQLPTEEEIAALFNKVETMTAQISELNTKLNDALEKMKQQSDSADSQIKQLSESLHETELKYESESATSITLKSNIDRIQQQNATLSEQLVALKDENAKQKEAFDRIVSDQSNVNQEIVSQLKSAEEQLKELQLKYDEQVKKNDQLAQDISEKEAASVKALKRQESVSAASHKAYKQKQTNLMQEIAALLRSEDNEGVFKNVQMDNEDEVFRAMKALIEKLISEKKALLKDVASHKDQISRTQRMNDLMGEKIYSIAEEMNRTKKKEEKEKEKEKKK